MALTVSVEVLPRDREVLPRGCVAVD